MNLAIADSPQWAIVAAGLLIAVAPPSILYLMVVTCIKNGAKLTECRGCGEQTSQSARSCPKCGCWMPGQTPWLLAILSLIKFGFWSFVAITALVWMNGGIPVQLASRFHP